MQALEAAGTGTRAADPDFQLWSQRALLVVAPPKARSQIGVLGGSTGPALNPTRSLESGNRSDEMGARQPEGGRERLTGVVVRGLLGYGRPAERAAHGDAPEGARRTA
jgi:hypothetical protein